MNSLSAVTKARWIAALLVPALMLLNAAGACGSAAEIGSHEGDAAHRLPPPERIVSLLPAATEILFAIGAGDSVKGITYHSEGIPEAKGKAIVGGFFHPSTDRIRALSPDAVFYAPVHETVESAFAGAGVRLVRIEIDSIEDGLEAVLRIGRIVGREEEAGALVERIEFGLSLVRQKTGRIPEKDRLRVLRIMSTDPLMVPGDNSFQNEMIRAAGGIPPVLGKSGPAVKMTEEEWIRFDPQAVYGCDGHVNPATPLFAEEGWKNVSAVRNGSIFDFPCNLTCRAGIHTAEFVSWLSARLYEGAYADKENLVLDERIFGRRPVSIDVEYAATAQVAESRIWDFVNKTLLVDLKEPMAVLSTLEGRKEGVETVGNHYASPPLWKLAYAGGVGPVRDRVLAVVDRPPDATALLFTGADMDNLAVARASDRALSATALVTAGACGNAMRMSKDEGGYYEPGTINILLLPGARLTARAMSRAVITATEAKTAALLDLDVRSTYSGARHRATGTGTDNIIVAEGRGPHIDNAGGHSKMGELIARAVYDAVTEALYRQNGLHAERSVFRRLDERGISLFALLSASSCECIGDKSRALEELEQALLIPRYSAFAAAAFSINDDFEKGLVGDLGAFEEKCLQTARELSGHPIEQLVDLVDDDRLPPVLELAANCLLNGIRQWPSTEPSGAARVPATEMQAQP